MKFTCYCGVLIDDATDHLPHKAHVIPDQEWDAFWIAIDEAVEQSGPTARDKERACMQLRARSFGHLLMWQCSQCGRLYINDAQNVLRCFEPAAPTTPKNLLASAEK